MYHGSMESGGQGVYLANVTRELALRGHEVHVISAPPYPVLDAAVTHHRIETHSFQAMLLDRAGYFGRNPLSHFHPLNFHEFSSTRFTFSSLIAVFSLRAFVELKRVENESGPFDIVHDNQTLSYGTYLTRALLGRSVLANVHHPLDVDAANGVRSMRTVAGRIQRIAWYPWHMQRAVARRLDALISGSQASASLIDRTWGLPPGLMHPIYDGVDTSLFHAAKGDDETEPGTLLFVGNAEDYNKGVVYLLRAVAQLPPSMRAHLYLVGGPSAAPRVAPAEIARLGIEARVTIVGRVEAGELAGWYRRAQILVSPSLYEGFGLPAAEAMASGTAVIASDGGALPEVVADGESGVVVAAGEVAALAGAIGRLLADPARCRAMGEAGLKRARAMFTWPQTAAATEALYRDVLERRDTPAGPAGAAPSGDHARAVS